MLTLRDVIRDHLGASSTVALAPGLTLPELEHQVQTLDGATVVALGAGDAATSDAMLVIALEENRLDEAEEQLSTSAATTVCLLLPGSLDDTALWPRALSMATGADAQIVAAVPVQGAHPLVLVLRRGLPLTPPAPYLGTPDNAGAQEPDARRLALRTANELTLVSLTNTALLARLDREQREHAKHLSKLRDDLKHASTRAEQVSRRLRQVESSRSFKAVVAVARLRSKALGKAGAITSH